MIIFLLAIFALVYLTSKKGFKQSFYPTFKSYKRKSVKKRNNQHFRKDKVKVHEETPINYEIRKSHQLQGHYVVVMQKMNATATEPKRYKGVTMSSSPTDAGHENIPMKQNADPVKVKRKNELTYKLRNNKISKRQFDNLCKKEKLNSYFCKRIRTRPANEFGRDYVKSDNWHLVNADLNTAKELMSKSKE